MAPGCASRSKRERTACRIARFVGLIRSDEVAAATAARAGAAQSAAPAVTLVGPQGHCLDTTISDAGKIGGQRQEC